jgi:hypothetical protein
MGAADRARAHRQASHTPEPGSDDTRVALLLGDLRCRLRPVCGHWSEAEFEAVILRIARTKVRWIDAGYRD